MLSLALSCGINLHHQQIATQRKGAWQTKRWTERTRKQLIYSNCILHDSQIDSFTEHWWPHEGNTLAAFGSFAVKIYNFQGDWIIVVVLRLLAAAMFAVVNYYIYKATTEHLVSSQRHHLLQPNGKPTDILYMVVGLFGVASLGYAFYCYSGQQREMDVFYWIFPSLYRSSGGCFTDRT